MGHPEEAVLMEEYVSKEPMYMMEKAAEMGLFKRTSIPFPHKPVWPNGQL